MQESDIKREKEKNLVLAFDRIGVGRPVADWLTGDEYRAFIDSWRDLVDIYREFDRFAEVNIEIVDVYRRITGHLRYIISKQNEPKDILDLASKALAEIEHWMDELTMEAERNLYFIEDMGGEV